MTRTKELDSIPAKSKKKIEIELDSWIWNKLCDLVERYVGDHTDTPANMNDVKAWIETAIIEYNSKDW